MRLDGIANEKDAVAVMRRSTIVGYVPRKISSDSAAYSPFLADQRQRYYSIMSACARVSLLDPAHTHD